MIGLPCSSAIRAIKVMRDDVLNVSFPISPELNQTVTIQPDGYITLLNAGSVFVQGMTVPQVTEASTKPTRKFCTTRS